jgi:branched-chain amino acid transport system substrate-binding protein
MRTACLVITLLLLFPAFSSFAETLDDSPEVVSLYTRGKRLMREGDWMEAARVFEELSGRFPQSENLDLFIFNRARANYHFGNYDKALAGFTNFLSQFGDSPYAAHAAFFIGNSEYIRGNLDSSLEFYIDAFSRSTDPRLDDLIKSAIQAMVSAASSVRIGPVDFAEVALPRRCELMTLIATTLLQKQETESARSLLDACGDRRATDTASTIRRTRRRGLDLALVLPLSGELQSFGEEIYNGAVIAAELHRQETGERVQVSPYDTRGEPVDAARIVRRLARTDVDAVIGPLTSEEAAVAAATLNCEMLPLIAPAATEGGLTELGRSAFQLSPNLELQAVLMAEYAASVVGADSAAIITSSSREHLRMARVFTERFAELGGTVISVEYYRPRDTDFGPYIRDVKAALIGVIPDSVFYTNEDGDTLNIDAVSANVECLFLPGNPDQLRLLLPQIHFYNLNGEYLGSDGWGDDAVYRLGDDITKEAVFPSPFLQFASGVEYDRLAKAYDARYAESPQRLAALGYDAVRLITLAMGGKSLGHEEIVAHLADIRDYKGAAAPVTFGEHRENVELPIYRIVAGSPLPVGTGKPAVKTTP